MRPQGMEPRFGGPRKRHRPNSSNQNSPRPQFSRAPFPKSPQQPRGNGNPNGHGRMPGPFGPMVGPNGPMMGPNGPMMRPMMGPNGPMMGPNGPMIGPMMGPFGPMMGPNGPMPPPGFLNPLGFNKMKRPPHQPSIKSEEKSVVPGKGGRNNEDCTNYDYSQFGTVPEMNCGWPVNTFPSTWNFGNSFGQPYYQNYDPGYDQQYSESYDQYYNQGQPFMQNNYTDVKPNSNQNGNTSKNKKRNERCQKMRTHYCDTCDRSFPNEEDLATHISEHVVCGLDECKYTANPRVVQKHQQMQHHTGLYRRIGSLYTPEDIEKWRKNRKKNYPTPQNVEQRRAKQEEMFARGERMGMTYNRGPRNNNHQRNGRFQQRQNARANHHSAGNPESQQPPPNPTPETLKKWRPIFPPVSEVIEESEERSGVKPFPGTAALYPKDPDSLAENDKAKPVEPITTLNSLSFLSQYGDGSSEEDSDTEKNENDSTVAAESCASTRVGVEAVENGRNSSQAEPQSSDHPLLVSNSSEDTVCTSSDSRKSNEDESLSIEANPVPDSPLKELGAPKDEKDSATLNEGSTSLESEEPSSRADIPQTNPPSKESQPEVETECSSTTSITNIVTSDVATILDDKRIKEAESNPTEMTDSKDGKDDSDDSGPEEVPVVKSNGVVSDEEGEVVEEVGEVASGGGGRKRKRPSRQPKKKLKVDDEKKLNQNDQQQQPPIKNPRRSDNYRIPQPPPIRREPTLLEKLLSKEICHERNVILQCVRYVVENNYFRNDGPKSS